MKYKSKITVTRAGEARPTEGFFKQMRVKDAEELGCEILLVNGQWMLRKPRYERKFNVVFKRKKPSYMKGVLKKMGWSEMIGSGAITLEKSYKRNHWEMYFNSCLMVDGWAELI